MNTSLSTTSNAALRIGKSALKRAWSWTAIVAGMATAALGQTPCVDGLAGQYPCQDMDLMCVRSFEELGGMPPGNGNDCWGWSHDGREFVLFGRSDGTSIIEVTDPVNPVMLANVPTATVPSLWRDIKVIGDVAYIVSEAGAHGLQVVDLGMVPNLPPGTLLDPIAFYAGFGNAHNVVANPETGYIYGVGTDTFSGGLHIVDVNDPLSPNLVGSWDESYIHDAQAVVYNGPDQDHAGREIVFAFCGYGGVRIIDVEDKTDCQTLSMMEDTSWVYVHQGWLTEDHRFIFMNDEIDEVSGVADFTRTWVLDVQDLDNPQVVGFHESNLEVTDHNLYTHQGKVYQANYYAGLQVLDIVDPASAELALSASFDTNPFWNAAGTGGGAWSVYPYFESGNIAISTQSHFFMVRPSGVISVPEVAPTEPRLHIEAGEGWARIWTEEQGMATVLDMTGRIQAEFPLVGAGAQTVLTEGWPTGAYVVVLPSGRRGRWMVN